MNGSRADGETGGGSGAPDILTNLLFLLFHTENGYFKRLRMSVFGRSRCAVQESKVGAVMTSTIF